MNYLEYKGYKATIEYSQEDDVLVGKVIDIDDSITFEGQSLNELKDTFSEAIDDWQGLLINLA